MSKTGTLWTSKRLSKLYLRRAVKVYVIFCTIFVTAYVLIVPCLIVSARTIRVELPNGAILNRLHLLSDRIVLRNPSGRIMVRDVAYIVFNQRAVAGEQYLHDWETTRFIYVTGGKAAILDGGGRDDPFEVALRGSGLEETAWPTDSEDLRWLDYYRLAHNDRYRRFWYE